MLACCFARDVLDDAVDAARGLDPLAGARWRADAGRNVAWARIVAMARSGPVRSAPTVGVSRAFKYEVYLYSAGTHLT